jgi:hypothetical protein
MKPHVIWLMASSVDGRTLSRRWRPRGAAGNLFERDELADDAWLVGGRVTGQEFAREFDVWWKGDDPVDGSYTTR